MSKVLAAIATAVLLMGLVTNGVMAAPPDAVPGSDPGPDVLGQGPTHWQGPGAFGTWGTPEPRPRTRLSLAAVDNLVNPGNGEIMPTTHTHLIFWLPAGLHFSGGTDAASDLAYETQITRYFDDVGGSQILNTATQYPGNNGTPADTSDVASSTVDTAAYPHAGTSADPVTQTDLNNKVFSYVTSTTKGMSHMYFVFLPNNVVDCDHAPPSASCNTNAYCAYHTYGWSGSDTPANDFIWADIPDNRSTATIGGCGNSTVTGNNSADTTLSSVEHEQLEAITDPRLNAWQDSTGLGGENGDKCNRNMGVANATTANNYLGAGNTDLFRIQREWSNAAGGGGCAASYTTTGSFVESPVPTGSDVTKSVLEASIPGNPADILHYTVTFTNPSNQDDAFNVVVTDTLPAGITAATTTFNLGDLAPHQTASVTFTAQPTGPLAAGTTLTNSAAFDFDDSTGAAQPTITRTASTTVVNALPVLTVPGAQAQDYHDVLTFGVSATDADVGDTLSFGASGLPAGLTLTDNGDRTATVSGTINDTPGVYTATITVTDGHHAPVSDTVSITVNREETTTTYTGPTVIAQGNPVTLAASLLEDGTTGPSPSGQNVTLSVGSQSCVGIADPSGNVNCTIPNVTVALGPQPLAAVFGGDTYYLPSSDTSKQATVFAFPSRGDFAIGDITSASATPSTVVTFWASDWYLRNQLSGGVAPTDFKGFTATLSSNPPVCGGSWITRTGNSPPPPNGPLPSYMGVIVTSSVSKSGSSLTGNIVHIVVVTTNPGYQPNPGHNGTGKIVATYC
jgi:uncharacterized repeat protein (TIGR01451 family)